MILSAEGGAYTDVGREVLSYLTSIDIQTISLVSLSLYKTYIIHSRHPSNPHTRHYVKHHINPVSEQLRYAPGRWEWDKLASHQDVVSAGGTVGNHMNSKGEVQLGEQLSRSLANILKTPSYTLDTIVLGDTFDRHIGKGVLPPSLRYLRFGNKFNRHIGEGVFPPFLEHLVFGYHFNRAFSPRVLPPTLKTLVLGDTYTRPIPPLVLPHGLETLSLGERFNHTFNTWVLPPCLTSLVFRGESIYNRPLHASVLPPKLSCVYLGNMYTHSVALLPPTLRVLVVGNGYSMYKVPLDSTLCNMCLRILILPDLFNHPIAKGTFPKTLHTLQFGRLFNQSLVDRLPSSLLKLTFGDQYRIALMPETLPEHLQELHLGGEYNHPVSKGVLPETLETLTFSRKFDSKIFAIPPGLKTLRFGPIFNHPLPKLPTTLRRLNLGFYYDQVTVLPDGLIYLQFGVSFRQSVSILPHTLLSIRIWDRVQLPVKLPSGLYVSTLRPLRRTETKIRTVTCDSMLG